MTVSKCQPNDKVQKPNFYQSNINKNTMLLRKAAKIKRNRVHADALWSTELNCNTDGQRRTISLHNKARRVLQAEQLGKSLKCSYCLCWVRRLRAQLRAQVHIQMHMSNWTCWLPWTIAGKSKNSDANVQKFQKSEMLSTAHNKSSYKSSNTTVKKKKKIDTKIKTDMRAVVAENKDSRR